MVIDHIPAAQPPARARTCAPVAYGCQLGLPVSGCTGGGSAPSPSPDWPALIGFVSNKPPLRRYYIIRRFRCWTVAGAVLPGTRVRACMAYGPMHVCRQAAGEGTEGVRRPARRDRFAPRPGVSEEVRAQQPFAGQASRPQGKISGQKRPDPTTPRPRPAWAARPTANCIASLCARPRLAAALLTTQLMSRTLACSVWVVSAALTRHVSIGQQIQYSDQLPSRPGQYRGRNTRAARFRTATQRPSRPGALFIS